MKKFAALALLLCGCGDYYGFFHGPDWRSSVKIPMLGGVNLLQDPRAVRDDEVRMARNVVPTLPGVVGTRGGFAVLTNMTSGSLTPQSFMIPPFDTGIGYVTAAGTGGASGNTFIFVNDPGGGYEASLDLGYRAKRPWLHSQNKKIYVFSGYPSPVPGKVIQANESSTYGYEISNFTWSDSSNTFAPAVATAYRLRTVYGNLGPGFEDYIVFSDRFQPNVIGTSVLAANGRAIRVGDRDGDRIVALVEIMLTSVGSPDQSALLVLRERSAYVVTGEPNQTTDVGDPLASLVVSKVSFDCGCSAPETVAQTPYGVYWAGPDDVWYFQYGQVPVRVGSKIRPALLRTAPAMRYRWHAAYFNGFYRLAVAGEGQNLNDTDPLQDQWWLDLRDGPPPTAEAARWWGPQQFTVMRLNGDAIIGTTTFAMDSRPGKSPELYGLERSATADGVDSLNVMLYDSGNTRDLSIPSGGIFTPDMISGTEIPIEIQSKEYDFGDPMIDKLFQGAEVNLSTTESAQLLLDVLPDFGVKKETDTQIISPSAGFQVDTDAPDAPPTLAFPTQSVAIWPNPLDRLTGKTFSFRLRTVPGITIGFDNNKFLFTAEENNYTAVLPQGVYANISAFATALATAMTTAFPAGSFSAAISGSLVRITQTGSYSVGWNPRFVSGGSAADMRMTRRLGALLGYDTSINPSAVQTQIAAQAVFPKTSPAFNFGGLNVNVVGIPRRPH